MDHVVEEIKSLLAGQGIPVFGTANSALLENEARNYRCSDTLESAKSILCIGMPFPKGIFYSRHRTAETYWRAANIYYRNADMILLQIARMIEENLNFRNGPEEEYWRPPVVRTEARDGEGIDDLVRAIDDRRRFLEENPHTASRIRQAHALQMLADMLKTLSVERFIDGREDDPGFQKILEAIADRKEDPYTAAERLLKSG